MGKFPERLDLKRFVSTFDLDGSAKLREQTGTPTTPPANSLLVYAKDLAGVSHLYWEDDAGVEHDVGSAAIGTGVAGRVAFWSGTTTLSSDTDLTFSVDTLTATKIVGSTSITDSGVSATAVFYAGTGGLLSGNTSGLVWDNANLAVGLGAAPSLGGAIEIFKTNPFIAQTAGSDIQFPNYQGRRARNTIASPQAVQAADILNALTGVGHDGSAYQGRQTSVLLQASETWSGTARGCYVAFETTPSATTTKAEAVRITPLGGLNVGQTTDITAGVISVLTGYRIGNAAASGNVLRGNGTNFVSAQLAITDLTTFSSANLAAQLTDETGTGLVVFNNTPTLTTPTIGSFTNATHNHQNAAGGGTLSHNSATDNPSSGTHGVTGSVVGTSDSQTITNKKQGVVGTSAFARMLGITPHTAAPAGALASDEWDISLYDDGANPVVRFRYNDAGTTKTVDIGPLV